MTVTFNELELTPSISKAVSQMGFEEATPIQKMSIPLAKQGKDLIGQAQTGTGKTAAFGIPMLEKIDPTIPNIQGLVVTPTRELAVQVAEELNKLGRFAGVQTLPVYGGQEIIKQIKALKKRPQIIVGTPGRLLDHIRRRTIRLANVDTVVLDEADEMLNMGFIEDIENILKQVPEQRQTLLFSATMPKPIQKLAENFMKEPEIIRTKTKEVTVENIEQQYFKIDERQKFDVLCRLLDTQAPDLAIVFGRTKRRVDELNDALRQRGYSAKGLHGDLNQAKRDRVMDQFKRGQIKILIATDVAARGLDISGVTHVYNFDIPQDPEGYVHRIGRTGRAGSTGMAVTFVTPREMEHLDSIERLTKHKITQKKVPTFSEAIEGQQQLAVEQLLQTAEKGKTADYKQYAEQLLQQNDSVTLLAAALKMITKEPDTTPVKLTAERPLSTKKTKNKRKDSYKKRDRRPKGSYNRRRRRNPSKNRTY